MRILICVPYSVETSGTLLFATPLCCALNKQGVKAEVIAFDPCGDLVSKRLQDLSSTCRLLRSQEGVLNWVDENAKGYDAIFWAGFFLDGKHRNRQIELAKKAKDSLGVKQIFFWERTGFNEAIPEPEWRRILIEIADHIGAPNLDQARDLIESGFSKEVVSVFTPGIDTEKYSKANYIQKQAARGMLGYFHEDTVMLCMSRFVKRKRIDFVIETWNSMSHVRNDQGAFPKLLVVGTGFGAEDSNEEQILQLARGSRSVNVILFDHEMDHQKFYDAADVFVTASLFEGEPQAVQEAMACELPILASDIAGHQQLVLNSQTGYRFPVDDRRILIDQIHLLTSDSPWREQLGQNAREKVAQDRSIEGLASQLVSMINGEGSTFSESQICSHANS